MLTWLRCCLVLQRHHRGKDPFQRHFDLLSLHTEMNWKSCFRRALFPRFTLANGKAHAKTKSHPMCAGGWTTATFPKQLPAAWSEDCAGCALYSKTIFSPPPGLYTSTSVWNKDSQTESVCETLGYSQVQSILIPWVKLLVLAS